MLGYVCGPIQEVGRRGRKRGRTREEYWDVWDCEQLKRSAAVECLMSASDQVSLCAFVYSFVAFMPPLQPLFVLL